MHRQNAQQQRQNAAQQQQNAARYRPANHQNMHRARHPGDDDYERIITLYAFIITLLLVAALCCGEPKSSKSTAVAISRNTTEDAPYAFIHTPSDDDIQNCTTSCVAAATASVRTLYKLGVNVGMIRYGSFIGVHICANMTYVDCADICSRQGWVVA